MGLLPNHISPTVQDTTHVELDTLTTAITALGKMFKIAIQVQNPQAAATRPKNTGPATAGTSGPSTSVCNFCGIPGHYIQECEIVEEFIRFGKCKRNPKGKVVLPSGAMVPHGITWTWLHDHVDEWHRQNPGQLAAQMLFEVTTPQDVTALAKEAASQAYLGYLASTTDQYSGVWPARTYALRRHLPPHPEVVITTQPPCQNGHVA